IKASIAAALTDVNANATATNALVLSLAKALGIDTTGLNAAAIQALVAQTLGVSNSLSSIAAAVTSLNAASAANVVAHVLGVDVSALTNTNINALIQALGTVV